MKKCKSYMIYPVLLVMMNFGQPVFAREVAVIINAANSQPLSVSDVKNIYVENITNWQNGKKIKVYDQRTGTETRKLFSQKVLGMSAKNAAAQAANRKVTNTAKNPSKLSRESLIVAAVARNPNAIGYVDTDVVEGITGIRVVIKFRK